MSLILVFLVIVVIRLGEGQGWLPVWARSYGDDLVAIPLVLWLIRLVHRRLRRDPGWHLPPWHGLLAILFFTLVFEWILPEYFNRGTADYGDGLMYCLGFIYFQFFINARPRNKTLSVSSPVNAAGENQIHS
jgi:hypothetical protein